MTDREAIEKIEELAQAASAPNVPPQTGARDRAPYIVVPEGYAIETLPIPEAPNRIDQRVDLHDEPSFTDYYARFKETRTAIFFDETSKTFTAVLDFHNNAKEPAFCDPRATYTVKTSPEWDTWKGGDRKPLSQVE